MNAKETYPVKVGEETFNLPIVAVAPNVKIALFNGLANAHMTAAACKALKKKIEPYKHNFDVVISAESKGITFATYIAAEFSKDLIILTKSRKPYIKDYFMSGSYTFTTNGGSNLYADASRIEEFRGKRFLAVDDVVSTGSSIEAMKSIIQQYEGEYYGAAAVLAEGDSSKRRDLIYLDTIPVITT